VVIRSVYATFRISVSTVLDVYRGTHRREVADRRLRWWSHRLLQLAEISCNVVNLERFELPPGKPIIIMSNHSSIYDIPIIFVSLPGSIRMLTKRELFRVPIWGRAMRGAEFISITRNDHAQALRDLDAARAKMQSGIILWIAPEGTRSRDGSLGEFKKGGFMLALETDATIVPVGIRGAHDVLPAGTLALELAIATTTCVGRPIDASAYTVETRAELMAEVERNLREAAGL
jgi:1-acyl-sn-glycerol-3-phosphate acyltransferase